MNILFPSLVGLFGAYLYQRLTGSFRPEQTSGYIKSFIIIILVQILLCVVSSHAGCVKCEKCQHMWVNESDKMLYDYRVHFEKCEELYENIRLISEHHRYDHEDLFVSSACGGILALQIPDTRAKVVAVALTIASDYFKESYYCHRALRRYAESYRYEVYLMEKCKDQLLENVIMCSNCAKIYEYENYDGVGYYKYLEYWKPWWDERDRQNNFGPGCWHTYKNTYKFSGDE